ncbi:MAG: tRNA (N(6)-L-threonylcarbamoyladenosine(37)-C(2))-methylthiotransferase MtaB, partial [Clostridia bacterium]|nr:tRNA (N(6)-L-threonylcarbamoyladenosine(37)-C(2))-methylthiotransferase MtaB [Clostridia bacterium]
SVKRERTAKLIELGNKLEAAYAKEMIGTVREVLFEENGEGYTPEYVRVRADEAAEPGSIRRVLIERTEDELALGRVLHEERSE